MKIISTLCWTQIFKDQTNGEKKIPAYVDDFLIMTKTIEYYFQVLEKIFKLLANLSDAIRC